MLGAGMMVVTHELQRPASEAPSAGPFDITITGRRISLRHRPTGHIYEYFSFRTAPHFCCGRVREKQGAEVSAWRMCAHAREAAILELQQARLLEPPTNGSGVGS